jgi:dTDP-4-dehydrorhamnose reductase
MKILLTGSKGMLGTDCREVLGAEYDVIALDRKELDITKWDKVIDKLHYTTPDIILNCAAFTDVDACENESFTVRKINVEGPRNLAQGSARFSCKLIHLSTDYVFNGQKTVPQPYFEDDSLDPLSGYGRSKMESEVAVRENASDYVIVRSGWLYGIHGKNFITSILSNALNNKKKTLKVVKDQFGSPTWTYRLAVQIRELIKADAKGTYHATAEGYCSRLECAEYVFKKMKIQTALQPSSLDDHKAAAKRPVNCVLENRLLKKQGIHVMADWKEDLDTFLEEHGEALVRRIKTGDL